MGKFWFYKFEITLGLSVINKDTGQDFLPCLGFGGKGG
jgi:hypothetical protein